MLSTLTMSNQSLKKDKGISVKVIEKDTFEQLDALPLDGSAGIGPDVTLAPFDRVGQGASQGYLSEVKLPKDDRFNEKDQRQVSLDGKDLWSTSNG